MPDPTAAAAGIQDPEPGFRTTEFWVTILTLLLPLATLIWHQDFSSQIQSLAVVAAGLASAIYAVARSVRKASTDKSRAAAVAAVSQVTTPVPAAPAPEATAAVSGEAPVGQREMSPTEVDLLRALVRSLHAAPTPSKATSNGQPPPPVMVILGS